MKHNHHSFSITRKVRGMIGDAYLPKLEKIKENHVCGDGKKLKFYLIMKIKYLICAIMMIRLLFTFWCLFGNDSDALSR